jgi:hypothetical protein
MERKHEMELKEIVKEKYGEAAPRHQRSRITGGLLFQNVLLQRLGRGIMRPDHFEPV